jgi:hypothetical protein
MARPLPRRNPKKRATYQDVIDAPEHLIAEILGGKLVLTPHPMPPHQKASLLLARRLGGPSRTALAAPARPDFRAEPFEAAALDLSNIWKW